jgi:hypothetical protein
VSLPWAVVDQPSSRVYDIVVAEGGCDGFTHMVAQTEGQRIRVTAAGTRANSGGCDDSAGIARARLTLTATQAGMPLIHAPLSADWKVGNWTKSLRNTARCLADPDC